MSTVSKLHFDVNAAVTRCSDAVKNWRYQRITTYTIKKQHCLFLCHHHHHHQSSSSSINQTINLNQSTNHQSYNHWINHWINQSQSVNKSINHQSINQSINQSIINQSSSSSSSTIIIIMSYAQRHQEPMLQGYHWIHHTNSEIIIYIITNISKKSHTPLQQPFPCKPIAWFYFLHLVKPLLPLRTVQNFSQLLPRWATIFGQVNHPGTQAYSAWACPLW